MIVHVALFKWKDGTSKELIARATKEVLAMKSKVPGLIEVTGGENFSRWGGDYTTGFVVLAKDKEALNAYMTHKDHQAVAKLIDTMEERSIGFDFES